MKKKAFTVAELLVVVTIMIILISISFITYTNYMASARNSQRIVDLATISSALELNYKTNWILPEPKGNAFWIWKESGDSNVAFNQWQITNDFQLDSLSTIPMDPATKTPYIYGKTVKRLEWKNKEQYQVSATLEWEKQVAMVRWNFQPVSDDYPSLIIAWNSYDSNIFVLNNQSVNLAYSFANYTRNPDWTLILWPGSTNEWMEKAKEQSGFALRHSYKSCKEIINAGKYMWKVTYQVLKDWNYQANEDNCEDSL